MAPSKQPHINWDNEVQPLARHSLPVSPAPALEKSLAVKVQEASRHPWGAIDYHLYLATIERGRDDLTRRNKLMLLGSEGLYPVRLDDLHDQDTFAVSLTETHIVTFMNMPILPLSTLAPLTEEKLVLGFDLQRRHIMGYFFESAPDDLADVWYVWHEGQVVIDMHVDRFLDMYQYVVNDHLEILGEGLFRYFRECKRELPTGMDLVVTIQFVQFLRDMAGLLWDGRGPESVRMEHEEHLRTLLSRASWESWFAVRDGLTIQEYREKMISKAKQVTSCDLLFEMPSKESSPSSNTSLSGQSSPSTSASFRTALMSEQMREVQSHASQVFFTLIYFFAMISE